MAKTGKYTAPGATQAVRDRERKKKHARLKKDWGRVWKTMTLAQKRKTKPAPEYKMVGGKWKKTETGKKPGTKKAQPKRRQPPARPKTGQKTDWRETPAQKATRFKKERDKKQKAKAWKARQDVAARRAAKRKKKYR